jgi:hypothetical protein
MGLLADFLELGRTHDAPAGTLLTAKAAEQTGNTAALAGCQAVEERIACRVVRGGGDGAQWDGGVDKDHRFAAAHLSGW